MWRGLNAFVLSVCLICGASIAQFDSGSGKSTPFNQIQVTTATEQVTEVVRTRINLTASANINTGAGVEQRPLAGITALNEIGVTLNGNNFVLPPGANYLIRYSMQIDANSNRTNFITHLRNAANTANLQSIHGNAYSRNAQGHDNTSLLGDFPIEGGGEFSLATQREANAGDVDLDADSYIEITAYRPKTITYVTGVSQ